MAVKLSKKYLAQIRDRGTAFGSVFFIALFIAVASKLDPNSSFDSFLADVGMFAFIIFFVLLAFSPLIIVQLLNLKVKSPKPYFVEPGWFGIACLGLSCLVLPLAIFGVGLELNWHIGVIGALAIIGFAAPINIYTINAAMRYKRIIGFGSAEWRKKHKK